MKRNLLLAVMAVVVFLIPMACDETTSTSQKMFGGSLDDMAFSVQQTSDGGYIVAGYSDSTDISGVTNNGNYDVYIIKLNSNGALQSL